jgi:hypothetical protein
VAQLGGFSYAARRSQRDDFSERGGLSLRCLARQRDLNRARAFVSLLSVARRSNRARGCALTMFAGYRRDLAVNVRGLRAGDGAQMAGD